MKGLRAIRKKKGLSQVDLERLTGIDANTFSRYERGVIAPSPNALLKTAQALNVTVDELLNGPEEGTREFKLILDKEGVMNMDVVNISGNAPEEKALIVTEERMAIKTNLKTAGMDKEALKKTLWEEFCKVFEDGWAQQQKWLVPAGA